MSTTAKLISALQIFVLDGVNYLGQVEKTKTGFDVTNAVVVNSSSIASEAKAWMQAHNTNTLQSFQVDSQNASLITKELGEAQQMELNIVIQQIDMVVKYAVPNLHNAAIANI